MYNQGPVILAVNHRWNTIWNATGMINMYIYKSMLNKYCVCLRRKTDTYSIVSETLFDSDIQEEAEQYLRDTKFITTSSMLEEDVDKSISIEDLVSKLKDSILL